MWNARRPHLLQIVCVLSCLLPNEEVPLVYTHRYHYSRQHATHSLHSHPISLTTSFHFITILTIQEYGIQQYSQMTTRCAFRRPSSSTLPLSLHDAILSPITPFSCMNCPQHTPPLGDRMDQHTLVSLPSLPHNSTLIIHAIPHSQPSTNPPISITTPINPIGREESTGSAQSTSLSLPHTAHRTAESTPFHSQPISLNTL